MFEPISKNQILGSHSLEKVQTTCKSRVTLKQHKYYTTKLGQQKYLLDMELRCPILKFPQKNWTKHDVFFFLRLAPQEAFLPFLTFLRCFKPHQDLLWQISGPQKHSTNKNIHKTPHPPEIPEKKPYEKKRSIQTIQSILIWCSKPQNETFLSILFPCIDPAGQLPFAKASSRFRWSILDDRSLHWILVKVHVLSQASTSGFENND